MSEITEEPKTALRGRRRHACPRAPARRDRPRSGRSALWRSKGRVHPPNLPPRANPGKSTGKCRGGNPITGASKQDAIEPHERRRRPRCLCSQKTNRKAGASAMKTSPSPTRRNARVSTISPINSPFQRRPKSETRRSNASEIGPHPRMIGLRIFAIEPTRKYQPFRQGGAMRSPDGAQAFQRALSDHEDGDAEDACVAA